MNKYIVVALLAGILMGFGVGYICFWWVNLERPKLKWHGKIGIFYYAWYNPNSPVSWEYPKICDKPLLGYYNSCDSQIIANHLKWISELGVDFVILSYWGHYFLWGEWYAFQLNAIHQIFKVTRENITNVKLCLMIEPFDQRHQPSYNYTEIYNYIYVNFVEPYPTVYFKYKGKPLLTFFNNHNLTPQGIYPKDDRFIMLIIGSEYYADWIYTDLTPVSGPIPRNRQISVTPRFDDSRFRNPGNTVDIDLSEGVYDKQWKRAINLAKQNAIEVITICSWE